jgi:hypothetical protein
MKRLLLTLMVSVSLSAHADNITVRTWESPIPVIQMKHPSGTQFCTFVMPSGKDLFFVFKYDTGAVDIAVARVDWHWTNAGRVNFNIDGRPYFATMKPQQDTPEMLAVTLNENNGRDFLHDLYNGYLLTVTAGTVTQSFSLMGTASTITILNRCADTIAAERGMTPSITQALSAPFLIPPTTPIVAPSRSEARLSHAAVL